MKFVIEKYKKLGENLRLDAEYYIPAQEVTLKYTQLFTKIYKGFKIVELGKYFHVRKNDIPDVYPILIIQPNTTNTLKHEIVENRKKNARFHISISAMTNEISVYDLAHFLNHPEVSNYLGLRLTGSVVSTTHF